MNRLKIIIVREIQIFFIMNDIINFYVMNDTTLCWSSLLGSKNPITMQSETHGGNESDAMVFWAWWCIVLLFRGLNLKWLCKMKIFFLSLISLKKFLLYLEVKFIYCWNMQTVID